MNPEKIPGVRDLKRQRRIPNIGMLTVIFAAVVFLAGCGAGQNTAGTYKSVPGGLSKEKMGLLCYYRDVKDETFDSDMEIVEGRIDALTDGRYLREETELETESGPRYAVNFYVPGEAYGDYSLRDLSQSFISRPMNLWLTNDVGSTTIASYGESIALPREAMESVELLSGCPDAFNPIDYGMEQGEFIYLKIILTEEYCRDNPIIWSWPQPVISQDIEGYEDTSYTPLVPDAGNRCMICVGNEEQKGLFRSRYYTYTHEPLSEGFSELALPVIEWESGEEIKGTGQIESSEFKTATVLNEFSPEETYVSEKNWEQTLQAIRERLDAAGFSYALGHRAGDERSIVIRMEDGIFAGNFLDTAVKNADISFNALGEIIEESPSAVKASAEAGPNNSQSEVLSLDMSEFRKETFCRLSQNCEKAGGGRIILRINNQVTAYGDCDEVISDGRFVMTYNGYTMENGFGSPMEWLPDFMEALISGTPIPMIDSYTPAVTLRNTGQVYLSKEGYPCLPSDGEDIPRENLYAVLKSRIEDMGYPHAGVAEGEPPVIRFLIPESGNRNAQVAETVSRTLNAFKDEIYTYWIRIDFFDEYGNTVAEFVPKESIRRNDMRLRLSADYQAPFTDEDAAEIRKLLKEDMTFADFVSIEE